MALFLQRESSEEEQGYIVEAILSKRVRAKGVQYKVRWAGMRVVLSDQIDAVLHLVLVSGQVIHLAKINGSMPPMPTARI